MCKFDKFWVKFERIDFFSPRFRKETFSIGVRGQYKVVWHSKRCLRWRVNVVAGWMDENGGVRDRGSTRSAF